MSRGTRLAIAFITTVAATLASTQAWAAGGDTCAKATAIAALPFVDSAGNDCAFASDVDNTGAAACADLPGTYPGPDAFYEVTLGTGNSVAFDLTMTAGATGDLAIFLIAEASCGAAGKCAASSIDVKGAGQGPERIKTATYPAGRYYLVVDSSIATGAGSCGAYTLNVTGTLGAVTPPDTGDAGSDAGPDGATTGPGAGGAGGTGAGGGGGVATTDSGATTSGDASPDGAVTTNTGGTSSAGGTSGTSSGGSSAASGGAGGATSTGSGGAKSSGGSVGVTTDSGLTGGENPDASTGSTSHESSGCDCAVGRGTSEPTRGGGLASLAAVVGVVAFARRRRR
ncbi:MAG TPA: MYXO-CTERM sorting domain-containing protein [Polyangiaceae bacterium]|jgi:hypothetical protein|nr:MYXO-CTERM sorting domain-containing protein [Polyangiaceae bacterium]